MNGASLITVASYSFPHEAHIAKASLEAEGIPVFIADEHTINAQWLYSNALGGVRLQVPGEYADAAKQILAQDYSHLLAEEIETDEAACPKCGGKDIVPCTLGKKPAFIVFLLLGFPLYYYRHGVRCKTCGEFTKDDPAS